MGVNISEAIEVNRTTRHMQAVARSDYEHLKQCLLEASRRFADLADIIERDPSYDPVAFMRASAERFQAEAEAV